MSQSCSHAIDADDSQRGTLEPNTSRNLELPGQPFRIAHGDHLKGSTYTRSCLTVEHDRLQKKICSDDVDKKDLEFPKPNESTSITATCECSDSAVYGDKQVGCLPIETKSSDPKNISDAIAKGAARADQLLQSTMFEYKRATERLDDKQHSLSLAKKDAEEKKRKMDEAKANADRIAEREKALKVRDEKIRDEWIHKILIAILGVILAIGVVAGIFVIGGKVASKSKGKGK